MRGLGNLTKLEIGELNANINNLPQNLTELKIISFRGGIINHLNDKLEKFTVNFDYDENSYLNCNFPKSLIELNMSYYYLTEQPYLKSVSHLSNLKKLIINGLKNNKPFDIPSSVIELNLGLIYRGA